jgi:hypothetical protein
MPLIPSNIQNQIRDSYRAGASIPDLAKTYGYPASMIEKLLFPHGKAGVITHAVHRVKKKKPWDEGVTINQLRNEFNAREVKNHPAKIAKEENQKKKWSEAGKKSWQTRMRKLAEQQGKALPPPTDQPIAIISENDLVTMTNQDKEEMKKLATEAMEYFEVGMANLKRIIELLNK